MGHVVTLVKLLPMMGSVDNVDAEGEQSCSSLWVK